MKNYSFDERVTLSTKWVTFAKGSMQSGAIGVDAKKTGIEYTDQIYIYILVHQLREPAHIVGGVTSRCRSVAGLKGTN